MKKTLSIIAVFILGVGFGVALPSIAATGPAAKPAYMIVSSERKPGADYSAYSAAAGPLAREAGLQMLAARKEPLVLEGAWPYQNITLEVYPSMDAVTDFWYSDEYQDAKKLREGLADVHFIFAFEAD